MNYYDEEFSVSSDSSSELDTDSELENNLFEDETVDEKFYEFNLKINDKDNHTFLVFIKLIEEFNYYINYLDNPEELHITEDNLKDIFIQNLNLGIYNLDEIQHISTALLNIKKYVKWYA
jgi:hypothetical protein